MYDNKNKVSANSFSGCGADPASDQANSESPIHRETRQKLWRKKHDLQQQLAEVEQSIEDLNDPVIRKTLNILQHVGQLPVCR